MPIIFFLIGVLTEKIMPNENIHGAVRSLYYSGMAIVRLVV